MSKAEKTIVLAAGGTGGHLFPAIALAKELLRKNHNVHLITDTRGAEYPGIDPAIKIHKINVDRLNQTNIIKKLPGLLQLALSSIAVSWLFLKLRPHKVVSFGGHPSLPAVLAAIVMRKNLIIHEQNRVLGKVNRMFAWGAQSIATTFPHTQKVPQKCLSRIIETGLPVREAIQRARSCAYELPSKTSPLNIFILGGSQGARIFGDVMPQAMKSLPEAMRKRVKITQQCRPNLIAHWFQMN